MPSAFSPNGDGKNDLFRIPPEALIDLQEFSVFNRWGQIVFSTKNKAVGWDGKHHGIMQTGLFTYTIKGSNDKGSVFLKGTVFLLQ